MRRCKSLGSLKLFLSCAPHLPEASIFTSWAPLGLTAGRNLHFPHLLHCQAGSLPLASPPGKPFHNLTTKQRKVTCPSAFLQKLPTKTLPWKPSGSSGLFEHKLLVLFAPPLWWMLLQNLVISGCLVSRCVSSTHTGIQQPFWRGSQQSTPRAGWPPTRIPSSYWSSFCSQEAGGTLLDGTGHVPREDWGNWIGVHLRCYSGVS